MNNDSTANLKVVLTAQDDASSVFSNFGENALKAGAALATVGASITGVMAIAVKAATDNATASANMHATLKAMGKDIPGVAEGIEAAAKAAVNLGFADDDATLSVTKFYQRTGDMTTALKLSHTAMDLSRAKNLDLNSATNLVNMALSGSGKALLAYGIHIKDAATPMQALAELQGQINGHATAFANTPQGQWDVLQSKLQLLAVTVGNQLLPVLTYLGQKLMAIISFVIDWTTAHPQLTKTIVLVVAAIGVFLLIAGSLLVLVGGLIVAFGSFGAVIVALVVGAIALLIGAAVAIIVNWQKIWDWLKTFWKAVVDGFKIMIQSIVDYFKPLTDILDATIGKLERVAGAVGGSISSFAGNVVGGAKSLVGARASGGPVSAGSTYLVGENGPEFFSPSTSGSIIPNGGGGAVSISVNINGGLITDDVARQIGNVIVQQFKRVSRW